MIITADEIKSAIRTLKRRKDLVSDQINAEVLKARG